MRYGLHSFTRRVWVSKGVRPVCPSQQRYEWGCLCGAVGVGLARSEFLHAETVDQEHLASCCGQIGGSDPAAIHVLITTWLASFWPDARRAFALIGRGWLLDGANASSATTIPKQWDRWYERTMLNLEFPRRFRDARKWAPK